MIAPATADGATSPITSPAVAEQSPVPFTPGRMALWLGALGALWLVLTALAEGGYRGLARAMAGLILGGAILALGPGAIANAQTLFTT